MNVKVASAIGVAVLAALTTVSFAQLKSDDLRVKVEVDRILEGADKTGKPIPEFEKKRLQGQIVSELSRFDKLEAEAIRIGLDKKPEVQASFQNRMAIFYAEQLSLDYQKNLKLTDSDIRETYELLTQKYKISPLSFATKEEADKELISLKKGKAFETLAKEIMGNSYVPYDLLTEMTIEEAQDEGEMSFLLSGKEGKITSEPIMTAEGYTLMKIEAIEKGKPLSNQEFEEHKASLHDKAMMVKTRLYIDKVSANR